MLTRKFIRMPALGCAGLLSLPLHAQVAPPAETPEVQSVTVTGEKMGRALNRTVSSVVVNTAKDLAEHADGTLTDVMARTPGVSTAPNNQTFSIRGMPVAGLGEQGPNDLISVYVDGAVQPRQTVTLGTLSVWDMEQVEILRGPQSTTQGRNAMAGAMVLQSKNPTFEPTLAGQLRAGRFGEQGAAAVVGGAIVADTLAGRLAVEHVQDDGYIRNPTLDKDANPRRSLTARAKLLWHPSADVDGLLTFTHTDHRRGNPVVSQIDDELQYYRAYTNADAWDNMRQNAVSAQVEARLAPAWTLTSVTALTGTQYDAVLDFDQTDTPPVDEVLRDHTHRLASQELRLAYQSPGAGLRSHLGLYLGQAKEDRDDRLFFDGAPVLSLRGDTEVRNRALFTETSWVFQPRWELMAGFRFDQERNSTASHFDDEPETKTTGRFDAFLPKLGISHQLDADHFVGAQLQRGYRGGGSAFNIAEERTVPFGPEYCHTLELTYRGRTADRSVQFEAHAYETRWTDQQVSVLTEPGNDNSAEVANAGRSRLRGVELAASADLAAAWRLYGSAAYNDARYLDFVTTTQDLSGRRFQRSPLFQLNLGMRWRGANGWMASLEATHQPATVSEYVTDTDSASPRYREVIDVRRGDAATLVNASVQYRHGPWTVSAYGKNLLDETYAYSRSQGTVATAGAPLMFGMSVRYDH